VHRFLAIGVAVSLALALCGEAGAWSWPADGAVLRPFTLGADVYAGGQHRGIDVAGPEGSDVRAPAAGVVTFAGSLPTYGHGVTILTADGYSVTLVHLGAIGVSKGDSVGEGAAVGTMGTSGTPEQPVPSVHLGIRRASDEEGYVDPLDLLPARPTSAPAPAPQPATSPQPVAAPVVVAPAAPSPQPSPPPAPTSAAPAPTAPAPVPEVPTTAAPAPSTAIPEASPAAAPSQGHAAAPSPSAPQTGVEIRHAGAEPAHRMAQPTTGAEVGPARALPPQDVATRAAGSGVADRGGVGVQADSAALVRSGVGTSPHSTATRAAGTTAETSRPSTSRAPASSPAGIEVPRTTVSGAVERPPAHGEAGPGTPHASPRGVPGAASRRSHPAPVAAADAPSQPPSAAAPAVAPVSRDGRAPGSAGAHGGVGLPEVAAGLALAVLLAAAVGRRVARRIGMDGAVLRHHADLLRQLDAAHRARVHDRGRGRVRAPSTAART
jgi:hypothetical protein